MSDRIAVMDKGRYEQLGHPEDLYERPKTRFVAGFLGVSNLLHTRPDGTADGYAICRLADETAIRVPVGLVAGDGDHSVGVRPEKVRLLELSETPPPGMNVARGVVRDASYLGVSTQYIVDLRSGEKVTVYEQNVARTARDSLFDRGEEAQVVWSPDHTFVVDGGEPSTLEEDAA